MSVYSKLLSARDREKGTNLKADEVVALLVLLPDVVPKGAPEKKAKKASKGLQTAMERARARLK